MPTGELRARDEDVQAEVGRMPAQAKAAALADACVRTVAFQQALTLLFSLFFKLFCSSFPNAGRLTS